MTKTGNKFSENTFRDPINCPQSSYIKEDVQAPGSCLDAPRLMGPDVGVCKEHSMYFPPIL